MYVYCICTHDLEIVVNGLENVVILIPLMISQCLFIVVDCWGPLFTWIDLNAWISTG